MTETVYAKYLACPRHAGALSRMDFQQALDYADDCDDCIVYWLSDLEDQEYV